MKRFLLTIMAICLMANICFASQDNKALIAETQLDDDPTSVTSSTFNIQDYEKISFIVKYDETEVGNSISVAVTLDISYDGTNWIDASFFDYGGGPATYVTSETLSSDSWYICWFNPNPNVIYARMVITATNSDADDLATVTAYIVGTK